MGDEFSLSLGRSAPSTSPLHFRALLRPPSARHPHREQLRFHCGDHRGLGAEGSVLSLFPDYVVKQQKGMGQDLSVAACHVVANQKRDAKKAEVVVTADVAAAAKKKRRRVADAGQLPAPAALPRL